MNFVSILFDKPADCFSAQQATAPAFFVDLNLDQIVDAVTANWSEYNLKPFFYFPLSDIEAIRYRHEVFQDLEIPILLESVKSFAQSMRDVRKHLMLTKKLYYQYHNKAWFLCAANTYCDAIMRLLGELTDISPKSYGFLAFRDYLTSYTASSYFASLFNDAKTLNADVSNVKYCVLIQDNSFTVRNYEFESDYSAEIGKTFEKFQQGTVKDYRAKYHSSPEDMNHIEAKILDFVALSNPDLFSRLDHFCMLHANFVDKTISEFDREINFYIAYLEHIARFMRVGLRFCYPHVSSKTKTVYDHDGFDLALAQKLTDSNASIVCNNFFLKDKERIIVVTGPNQGGKTTFARTFGQLHHLASIGCPVPGRDAQLFLPDQLFTHFEREENVQTLRGKLEVDLTRIHSILEQATPRSVVIMNEIFTSTTLQDELFLSTKVMEKIAKLDLLCVWVTFVDELASFSDQIVSMVSMIDLDNPTLRTFKIVRRPADGLAHAMAIAEKYQLTYDRLKERIKS
jgi:DNA mismatch repair protein MutS